MDEAIGGSRHGIVGTDQLRAVGETRKGIDYRLRVKRLHRVFRNAYAIGHDDITLTARYLAAVRSVGPDAVASDRTAGILWEFLAPRDEEELRAVEITAPRQVRPQRGLAPHERLLHPGDVTLRHGVPVTTPARTLLDLAAVLPQHELTRALRQAEVDRRVSHPQLRAQLARSRGLRGAARLRALVEEGGAPTRSPLEDAFLERTKLLAMPRPRMNVRLHGWEVDFHFAELGLVVECDGARWHDTPTARVLDVLKQEALTSAGLCVERVRWADIWRWKPPPTPSR